MKTSNLVKWVLNNDVDSRNSDLDLILKVWSEQGLHLSNQQVDTLRRNCSKPETIRRIRQKLQENGDYKADDSVEQERKWMGLRAQQTIKGLPVDKVENLTEHAIPWMDECR